MKKIIVGLVSMLLFVAPMAMAKGSVPSAPVVCSPTPQTVAVGQYIGMMGLYSGESGQGNEHKTFWSAPSADVTTGTGITFATKWSVAGDYFVTVTITGHGSSQCEVIVQ